VFQFLLAINPSISFLWAILADTIKYVRVSELDRTFDSIVRDVEEEMEEEEEQGISVAYVEDKAYWVLNNTFYQADIVDGEIDRESSRPIDPFKMSSKDIMKMLFILDNLTEG